MCVLSVRYRQVCAYCSTSPRYCQQDVHAALGNGFPTRCWAMRKGERDTYMNRKHFKVSRGGEVDTDGAALVVKMRHQCELARENTTSGSHLAPKSKWLLASPAVNTGHNQPRSQPRPNNATLQTLEHGNQATVHGATDTRSSSSQCL